MEYLPVSEKGVSWFESGVWIAAQVAT